MGKYQMFSIERFQLQQDIRSADTKWLITFERNQRQVCEFASYVTGHKLWLENATDSVRRQVTLRYAFSD